MSTTDRPFKASIISSARELGDFVASLKGRSPREAMGVVAQSHLVRAVSISALIHVAALVVLTVPFALLAPAPVPRPVAAPAVEPPPATRPTQAAPPPMRPAVEDPTPKVMKTEAADPADAKTRTPDVVDDLIDKLR